MERQRKGPRSPQKKAENQRGRRITPDSGIPHMLATMKPGSWILGESSHPTIAEEENVSTSKSDEEESHAARNITFSSGSYSTIKPQIDQTEVVQENRKV